MNGSWSVRTTLTLAALAVLHGCVADPEPAPRRTAAPPPPAPPAAELATPVDWPAAYADAVARADSVDGLLRRIPALSRGERGRLRRDVNAVQIERARRLGVRAIGGVEPLVATGRLVPLEDSTRHWVVRELDYSVPYVTPAAKAMLEEIAERFHARLDSVGAPRFRLDITSVLRTPEKQAELRRRNANASRVESAHEFGTTVDIAYRKYAAPEGDAALHPAARQLGDSLLVETARLRGAELQAALGRVLLEMQREGKLMVMMERSQTVYHITVARRLASRRAGS